VAQVALGCHPYLRVYGADYPTADGTGVRDYIHVVDLARGHVAALDALTDPAGDYTGGGVMTVNLGTGRGWSVFEVVSAFERASGRTIPCRIVDRRPGDVAECYADAELAHRLLGWRTEHDLDRICADAWRWQQMNPDGYPPPEPSSRRDAALPPDRPAP
jgi:UDP-glucose 4-epimerase